eukprot:4601411-Amphidinium_carterae.1
MSHDDMFTVRAHHAVIVHVGRKWSTVQTGVQEMSGPTLVEEVLRTIYSCYTTRSTSVRVTKS